MQDVLVMEVGHAAANVGGKGDAVDPGQGLRPGDDRQQIAPRAILGHEIQESV